MIIICNSRYARLFRSTKRFFKKTDLLSSIAIISGLLTIVGYFFGNIDKSVDKSLYLLVALSMLLMSHYCRKFFKEKYKNKSVSETHKNLHIMSECFRDILLHARSATLSRKQYKVGSKEWAESFCDNFLKNCEEICKELKSCFINLGYDIDHTCIKMIDQSNSTIQVIARSNIDRKLPSDKSEKINSNPFFRLLIETHSDYQTYTSKSHIRNISMNRLSDCPKFLAIGDVDKKDHPAILSEIIYNFSKKTDRSIPEAHSEQSILDSFKNRAKGRYNACLGVMISEKIVNREEDLVYMHFNGFIGIDSKDGSAWDYLDPRHVHIIASVADNLYCLLSFYKEALVILEQKKAA